MFIVTFSAIFIERYNISQLSCSVASRGCHFHYKTGTMLVDRLSEWTLTNNLQIRKYYTCYNLIHIYIFPLNFSFHCYNCIEMLIFFLTFFFFVFLCKMAYECMLCVIWFFFNYILKMRTLWIISIRKILLVDL